MRPRENPDARTVVDSVTRSPAPEQRQARRPSRPVHTACVHSYGARQPANARCRPRLMRHLLRAPGTEVRSVLCRVTMSTRAKAPTCWVCGLEERAHFDSKNMAFIWGLYPEAAAPHPHGECDAPGAASCLCSRQPESVRRGASRTMERVRGIHAHRSGAQAVKSTAFAAFGQWTHGRRYHRIPTAWRSDLRKYAC